MQTEFSFYIRMLIKPPAIVGGPAGPIPLSICAAS